MELSGRCEKNPSRQDRIRGCLFGGAVGDALGYPVEFMKESGIFSRYGKKGIQEYEIDLKTRKAQISDDTQMTLFTANGLLVWATEAALQEKPSDPSDYLMRAYLDWLRTQEMSFSDSREKGHPGSCSWLSDVPELYSRRLPGNTCLSALWQLQEKPAHKDFFEYPINRSKGCGGIMRVAPAALVDCGDLDIREIDRLGALAAAITHGHSLGYMSSAVFTHILRRIVFPEKPQTLKEIVLEARDTVSELFAGDGYLPKQNAIIDLAVDLSENGESDLDNIHRLGEGWVAEETLGIAIYCALKYQDDFSEGVRVSVNHKGDSDSTGAVAGNILGALVGYEAIDEIWKKDLELSDVVLEMADDLCCGCRMGADGGQPDSEWTRKYIQMRLKRRGDARIIKTR